MAESTEKDKLIDQPDLVLSCIQDYRIKYCQLKLSYEALVEKQRALDNDKKKFIQACQTLLSLDNISHPQLAGVLTDISESFEKKELTLKIQINEVEQGKNKYQTFFKEIDPPINGSIEVYCSICYNNKKDTALRCGHIFCQKCLQSLPIQETNSIKCPICRTLCNPSVNLPVFL